jgi:SAM-dependent methyltransferase
VVNELDVEVARWLVGPEGLHVVSAATRLLDDGEDELRVVTALRAQTDDPGRTAAAVAAGSARRKARDRWLEADQLLFTRESLEQASDPSVASWRARRFVDAAVHDLCSGVGGDAIALARRATSVTAVDLDEARLVLLRHNAEALGLDIPTRVGDALELELPPEHVVHVDPARRRDGHRIGDPTGTLPPVDALMRAHARAPGRAIVLAPGTDADHPSLGTETEVEYLQLGNDLVEAVAWSGFLRDGTATASATILPRVPVHPTAPEGTTAQETVMHRARVGERGPRLEVGPVGAHLVEVASAAIRARLHDEIGAEIGAHRLARHRALLTVEDEPPRSPWYRSRPVVDVLAARPAPLRRWLAAADRGPMELVLHGFRADPTGWWRDLGRPERGPGGIRIELVRRDDDAVAVITSDAAVR